MVENFRLLEFARLLPRDARREYSLGEETP